MKKYRIQYTRNGHEVTTTRKAERAQDAIESLCDQYKWRGKLSQYDADTRGQEWAEVYADPEGGINYSIRIVATIKE